MIKNNPVDDRQRAMKCGFTVPFKLMMHRRNRANNITHKMNMV